MPEFKHQFSVAAPLWAVAGFHRDTRVLRQLTPLPIVAQIHAFEPLAEGSRAAFTLWFGPLPLRWEAIHSQVGEDGFTDTQITGPLHAWRHVHHFTPLDAQRTLVEDTVTFEHHPGARGLLTRLLFARPGLRYLFAMRARLTRRGVARLLAERGAAG